MYLLFLLQNLYMLLENAFKNPYCFTMKLLTFNHFNANPFFNMAFDEWMFQKVLGANSLIMLRLYSWSEGTITFGFNQQQEKAFVQSQLGNTPVIRRVTGGRGLFHDESELTYSIAISADLIKNKIISESISVASEEIAKILILFLKELRITSDYVRQSAKIEKDKNYFHQAPCFDSFSKNEIIANEKKIIASAQRRISGSLLQHGSIKIKGLEQHKALPLDESNPMTENKISRITAKEFQRYKPLFFKKFEEYFSVVQSLGILSASEKEELKSREKMVLKKSIEKRDFIKQS